MRKLQATASVIVSAPLIKKDGTQAIGLTLTTLSTKIIKPDGTALTGYTEATFTEPNGDGVYVCVFSSGAATKAFTQADQANPYQLTLDSSAADVEPSTIPVWIVSLYPWEVASQASLNSHETSRSDMQTALVAEHDATQAAIADIKTDTAAILLDTGTEGVVTKLIDQDYITTGTAQGGNINSIILAASTTAVTDFWVGQQISIYDGTGAGQTRGVASWNNTTKVLTVARNWKTAPDATSKYKIHLRFGPKINNSLEISVADAGADLTAIPWSAAWDAEIQSGCADALTDYAPALASVCTENRLVNLDATVSSRLAATGYVAPDNTGIDFIEKWINNKLVENPAGTWTLYDDNNTTVLKTWTWNGGTATRSKAV